MLVGHEQTSMSPQCRDFLHGIPKLGYHLRRYFTMALINYETKAESLNVRSKFVNHRFVILSGSLYVEK